MKASSNDEFSLPSHDGMVRPGELFRVPKVVSADAAILSKAIELAKAAGEDYADNRCSTNSWFAANAARDLRYPDVVVVAGFRERDNNTWRNDPHVWVRIDGSHFEVSPGNDPNGAIYLQLYVYRVDATLRHRVFTGPLDLIEQLHQFRGRPSRPDRA